MLWLLARARLEVAGTDTDRDTREGAPTTEDRGPDPQPPKDDLRWLLCLAVGFVTVLALLLPSGRQSSQLGH
jgi:hypothetical protein